MAKGAVSESERVVLERRNKSCKNVTQNARIGQYSMINRYMGTVVDIIVC